MLDDSTADDSIIRYPSAASPLSERSFESTALDFEEEDEEIDCKDCGALHLKQKHQCHHCQRIFKLVFDRRDAIIGC